MRAAVLLTGLALLLAAPGAAAPVPSDAAALAWMSGDWVEEKGGRWTEERWSRPRGGIMLGTSLSGRGGRAAEYEFIRISADADGRLTYFASPQGGSPVPFRLVSSSRHEAVFENPKHDYPTRIVYRRDGDVLIATVSGPGGKNARTWRYRRVGD